MPSAPLQDNFWLRVLSMLLFDLEKNATATTRNIIPNTIGITGKSVPLRFFLNDILRVIYFSL
jgi:hypothetical protein